MHKVRLFSLFLLTGILFQLSALEVNRKNGCLVFDQFTFEVLCATPGWASQISQQKCPATIRKSDDGKLISCTAPFPIPGRGDGGLSQTLTKIGDGQWRLVSELQFAPPVSLAGVMLNAALPEEHFAGVAIQIDRRDVTLPKTFEGKAFLFQGKASEIVIRQPDGMLYLRGKFRVQLQDNRNWNCPGYSLRLMFDPADGDIGKAVLKMDIAEIPYLSQPLDLRSAVNTGFNDSVAGDGKGGWTDQGAENDLRMLPYGNTRLGGVLFAIGSAPDGNGNSCVVLGGAARDYFPKQAEAVQPNAVSGKYLSLLHALAWSKNTVIGTIRVTYADGTGTDISLQGGKDVGDWWQPQDCPNGTVVWNSENRSSFVGLYHSIFQIEEKPIRSVTFSSSGASVWGIVAASVHQERPPRPPDIPAYIVADGNWKPFEYKREIHPRSIMDFSGRLDAPAGKYGLVVVRNGKFVFRDRPETPIRFYGVNFGGNALVPDKKTAERIADRIAAAGYNAVRIHNHDNVLTRRVGGSSVELDPEQLDKLEYFIHCLKQRGIYLSTDLYVARKTHPGEIPEFPGKSFWLGEYKAMLFLFDSVKRNLKEFSRNWLTHVNPYTGLALKDDPALFSLSLVNENDIFLVWNRTPESTEEFLKRFDAWKAVHKPQDGGAAADNPAFAAFLDEQYQATFRDLRKFVRDLGVSVPLTDQNMIATLRTAAMRDDYDYVDIHSYWDHPIYLGGQWNPPSKLLNRSAISADAAVPARLMLSRHSDKPMMVTEFDFASPNMFRAEGPVLVGAYAAFQNWDGVFHYIYTNRLGEFDSDKDISGSFFSSAVDPVKYLSQIIGIRLFLDGGVKPAPEQFTLVLGDRKGMGFTEMPGGDAARLGLLTGVGAIVSPSGKLSADPARKGTLTLENASPALPGSPRSFPVGGIHGDQLLDALVKAKAILPEQFDVSTKRYLSSTGQIELKGKEGTFRVFSPECEAWVLPAGHSGSGPVFNISSQVGRGVFAAISADRRPLAQSGRMLLMHLTDTQVEKIKFSNAAKNRMERHGRGRLLAARGEATWECRLDPQAEYELYSVDTSGKRLDKLPVKRTADNKLQFDTRVFQGDKTVFLYELTKVK